MKHSKVGVIYGSPLQYSCLENPMDRKAWRATVHRVAKSLTRLKRLSMYIHGSLQGCFSLTLIVILESLEWWRNLFLFFFWLKIGKKTNSFFFSIVPTEQGDGSGCSAPCTCQILWAEAQGIPIAPQQTNTPNHFVPWTWAVCRLNPQPKPHGAINSHNSKV